MKTLIITLTLTTLSLINLIAQSDQQGIIERESTVTKEVEVKEENGIITVKILTQDSNGNEEITLWKGTADDEDMPDDIRVIIEDNLTSHTSHQQKTVRLKVLDEDGNEKLLEWDGTGEMPTEMKQLMEENGNTIDFDRKVNKEYLKQKHKEKRAKRQIQYDPNAIPQFDGRGYGHKYGSKARIGVKISEENSKVIVVETITDSAAEQAGVKQNDHITQLDDTLIDSLDRLYAELATHDPGDKVKMVVKRNGKTKTLTLILK